MRNAIKSMVGAFALLAAPAALAQTTLSLVYPFPDQLVYTKFCLELVDKVNKGMGGALKVEAGQNVKINAETTIDIKAGGDLKMTGSSVRCLRVARRWIYKHWMR